MISKTVEEERCWAEKASGQSTFQVSLIRRIKERDPSALAILFFLTVDDVVAVAAKILGSRREAEIVAEDVYLHAWNSLAADSLSILNVEGWLLRLSKAMALSRRQQASAAPAASALEILGFE